MSERSTISRLVRRCKHLVAKNGDSLKEADLLLLAVNNTITSFSDNSSY